MNKREIKQKQILKRILGGFLAVTIAVGSVPVYRSIRADAAETDGAVETASASDAKKDEPEIVVEPEVKTESEVKTEPVTKESTAKTETSQSVKKSSSKKGSASSAGAKADDAEPAGAGDYDPTSLKLTAMSLDGETITLTGDTYTDREGNVYKFSELKSFRVEEGGSVIVETNALNNADLEIVVGESGSLNLASSYSMSGKRLSLSKGIFYNYGTISIDKFNFSEYLYASFDNYGTLKAKSLYIYRDANLHDGSKIIVSDDFTMSGFNSEPPFDVEAEEDTMIESDGGSFNLTVNYSGGSKTDTVVGEYTGKAINAVGDDNDITFEKPDDVIYGVDYNLDKYITFSDGYKGNWHTEYGYEGTEDYFEGLPKEPGDYVVYVVAPASNGFKDAQSEAQGFSIKYYELPDGTNPSISGVANEYYAKDSVTINAPSGYQISAGSDSFSDSLSYTKDDLFPSFLDGAFNEDLTLVFRRNSDKATTGFYQISEMLPAIKNVIFDDKAPAISGDIMADGKAVSISDGDEVVAEEVKLSVLDKYLDKVETQSETYTRSNGVTAEGDSYKADITFAATEGEVQKCYFKAYDMSGRLLSLSFSLKHPNDAKEEEKKEEKKKKKKEDPDEDKKTPKITVSIENQYYGVSYEPGAKTDSDGDVTYTYANSSVMEFSESKPTMPGTYIVRATVEETEKYEEAHDEAEFSIEYLPFSGKAYTASGLKGLNDYYISDVTLSAPDNYSISTALGGKYSGSVTYIEGMSFVYLQSNKDGARTAGIPINEKFKIDKDAPKLLVSAGVSADADITSKDKVYADTIKISLVDNHLLKASVNGDAISVNNGRAEFILDSDNKRKTFQISAEDEAGNRYSRTVEVSALWLIKSIIPAGVEIELEGGNQYTLDSGKWVMTGDTTVYSGGSSVYVDGDMDMVFTKVQ